MSKIGRIRIPAHDVKIDIQDNVIRYAGKNASGVHQLSPLLRAEVQNQYVLIKPAVQDKSAWTSEIKDMWGLHRALLASKIEGARTNFERHLDIVGLGFKALAQGNQIEFSLGRSHKILYPIPHGVSVSINKTGQGMTLQGPNNELLGQVLSEIRHLRPPEPYKGTGIEERGKAIRRKAGKTKK